MKFFKSQLAFLLTIGFFFFCTNTFAINLFDYSPFALFVPVEQEIRNGNIITGLAHQVFQILVSGFDLDEIEYFTKLYNVFSPKKYLIVQRFKVPPNKGEKIFLIKVYCPKSISPFQKRLWQGKTCNSGVVSQGKDFILFASEKERETKIKICTIVSCAFISFRYSNFSLPENGTRESATKDISKKFKSISDVEEYIAFFGTYSPNDQLLPIGWILWNPFNIDCSEFATLVFEFLSDKGIDARYSLGILAANHIRNYGGLHCWIAAILNNQRIEIDPTLGRKVGKLAYYCHFPGQIDFTEFSSLEEVSKFPISFISIDGLDILEKKNYESKLTVYELHQGGDVW